MSNPAVDAIKRLQERNRDEMETVEAEMDEAFKVANALRDRYDELARMDGDYDRAIAALESEPVQGANPVVYEEPTIPEPAEIYEDDDMPQPGKLRFKRVKD